MSTKELAVHEGSLKAAKQLCKSPAQQTFDDNSRRLSRVAFTSVLMFRRLQLYDRSNCDGYAMLFWGLTDDCERRKTPSSKSDLQEGAE